LLDPHMVAQLSQAQCAPWVIVCLGPKAVRDSDVGMYGSKKDKRVRD
jgi:hypothetical protein